MKKNNKIRKIFLFIIYISIIPSIFSSITQFTEEELKEYNKLSNTADRLNNGITKYINDTPQVMAVTDTLSLVKS